MEFPYKNLGTSGLKFDGFLKAETAISHDVSTKCHVETISHAIFQLPDMVWSLVSLFRYPSIDIYKYPSARSSFLTPLIGPHV